LNILKNLNTRADTQIKIQRPWKASREAMLVMTPFVIGILALITLHIKKSQNTDMANRRDTEYHSQELKQAPFAAV
jgi:hypothetical protein